MICLRKWVWAEAESGQSGPGQVWEGRGQGAGGQVTRGGQVTLVILSSYWSGTSPSSSRAGRTEVSLDNLRDYVHLKTK